MKYIIGNVISEEERYKKQKRLKMRLKENECE